MLLFGVPILQSEAAPTQERETLWVWKWGKRWDGDLDCFFCAYVCYILGTFYHSQFLG